MAGFFWLVFSAGGIVLSVLIATIWVLARPESRAARMSLTAIVGGYTIVSIHALPHAVARLLARPFHQLTRADVPPGRSVVVLLASGNYPMRSWSGETFAVLDPDGAVRTLEAARVAQLVDANWVICSSDRADPGYPGQSAGQTMRHTLVELGVPTDRVIVEETSKTTHDGAVAVASILPSLNVDHVILVTSPVHMRRSIGVFRGAGIDPIPAIANDANARDDWPLTFLPTTHGLDEAAAVVHELGGLGYYALRGWTR